MGDVITIAFMVALVFGAIGAEVGKRKGRFGPGFWLGALLGPIGILIIAFGTSTPVEAANTMKKCPACAEMVQAEARLCRYCATDLT